MYRLEFIFFSTKKDLNLISENNIIVLVIVFKRLIKN